jgi:hypothetical protein
MRGGRIDKKRREEIRQEQGHFFKKKKHFKGPDGKVFYLNGLKSKYTYLRPATTAKFLEFINTEL